MAANSKIEWTMHTSNLWHGCTNIHEGCDNCYAEVLSHRWKNDLWGNDKPRKETKTWYNDLLKYQKKAFEAGEIHRVFIGSMMDIFEKPMKVVNHKFEEMDYDTSKLRKKLFEEIVPITPNLMYLFLTKRPSNINKYIPESWKTNPPKNVMFGTSVVNQKTADKLIPQLLEVNGQLFLSVEPMLDKIDLTSIKGNAGSVYQCLQPITNHGDSNRNSIDWVIVGGESGHGRRPFNTDWGRLIMKHCKQYNVPFFFKQIDKILPIPEDLKVREFPKYHTLKK